MIQNIEDQLARDEGRVAYAYPDSMGYLSIGIGILIDKRKGGKLLDEEIDFIFQNRLKIIINDITKSLPWTTSLDYARFGVLVNMAFQMGVTGLLGFKNTLELVRNHRWDDASVAMGQSLWAKQTPARAQRLMQQMKTGEWQ